MLWKYIIEYIFAIYMSIYIGSYKSYIYLFDYIKDKQVYIDYINKILVSTKKIFGKKEDIEYALTQNTLNAVLKGDAEILNDKKEQSFTAFLNLFHTVVYDNELDDEDVSSELSVLMDEFDKLEEIKYLKGERLCPEELAIYLFVVARQSIFGDTKVSLERIFRVNYYCLLISNI
jgi:hypothetical protein